MKKILFPLFLIIILSHPLHAQGLLIPMDDSQANHLKAYGIAYSALENNKETKWLLNYRGGSFYIELSSEIFALAVKRGVTIKRITAQELTAIRIAIENNNMAEIKLEKAPKIVVYTPPNTNPWADAVTLVLTYAEIPFDTLYDNDVLSGKLKDYDWLHLHHEDFTGQYSKFWLNYRNQPWFIEKMATFKQNADQAGFTKVSEHKSAVAKAIQLHVADGLFLFAMCSATETIDIALSTENIDIVPHEIDGDELQKNWPQLIDYTKTFSFEDFKIFPNVWESSYSDIDYNQVNTINRKPVTDFILFDFSAKLDPIPTILIQNHRTRIDGFFGQTTAFNPEKIKDGVTILARHLDNSIRYIHGTYGQGTFTFYGGHAPEDKNHLVGDKPSNLDLYRNSPGYRLILNNILFPSAKPPKKKT